MTSFTIEDSYSALRGVEEEKFSKGAELRKDGLASGVGYMIRMSGTCKDYVDKCVRLGDKKGIAEFAFSVAKMASKVRVKRLEPVIKLHKETRLAYIKHYRLRPTDPNKSKLNRSKK
jgi:hypothetical protein